MRNKRVKQIVIDPHYELKHSDSMSDSLIVKLVSLFDGTNFTPEAVSKGFEYYTTENLDLKGKNTDWFGFLRKIKFISVVLMHTGGIHEISKQKRTQKNEKQARIS